MKKILLLFIVVLFSCKKEPAATPTKQQKTICQININDVQNITWHSSNTSLADLTFNSNGIYYEDSTNDGNWTLSNGCDSIYVTRPSNNFYYRINSVNSTTLKLQNPVFGELIFTK